STGSNSSPVTWSVSTSTPGSPPFGGYSSPSWCRRRPAPWPRRAASRPARSTTTACARSNRPRPASSSCEAGGAAPGPGQLADRAGPVFAGRALACGPPAGRSRETLLAPGLVHGDGGGVGQVERPDPGHHGDPDPLAHPGVVLHLVGQAHRLGPEQEHVARLVGEVGVEDVGIHREGEDPAVGEGGGAGLQV